MIISPGRRYIFVHIPKTGGTSMALALEDRAMKDDILIGDTPKARRRKRRLAGVETRGRLWKHATLADIDGLVAPDALDDYFCFTLVRNPWARVVSYYHWLRRQDFDHPAVALARASDFESFVCHDQTRASFRATPARHYMTAADGRIHCAAYIRLEHLEGDLAALQAHLGFVLEMPHANRSDAPTDWRACHTDATRAAIAECCAEDVNKFGYRFA